MLATRSWRPPPTRTSGAYDRDRRAGRWGQGRPNGFAGTGRPVGAPGPALGSMSTTRRCRTGKVIVRDNFRPAHPRSGRHGASTLHVAGGRPEGTRLWPRFRHRPNPAGFPEGRGRWAVAVFSSTGRSRETQAPGGPSAISRPRGYCPVTEKLYARGPTARSPIGHRLHGRARAGEDRRQAGFYHHCQTWAISFDLFGGHGGEECYPAQPFYRVAVGDGRGRVTPRPAFL